MQTIPLSDLTHIEPDSKRRNCLVIQYLTSALYILFQNNSEMYTWRDALYLRSSLSAPIGTPTNFVHRVHVGFDALTGGFTVGHPSSWSYTCPAILLLLCFLILGKDMFTDIFFSRVCRLTGKPSLIPPSLQSHRPLSPLHPHR